MTAAPAVVEIEVADEPSAWRAAGFLVEGDLTHVGSIALRLIGRDAASKGIRSWSWSDLGGNGPIDGLATSTAPVTIVTPGAHPNGSTILDHVVVVTPSLERTVPAFEARHLEVRRVRHTDQYGPAFRQVFFRGGETIIELIGPDVPKEGDDRDAHFYGLAFTVADLDATAARLGDGLGSIKDAVQEGRRIATLRHQQYDISVPIALMSA
jgi:Glyoxalase/Bleomycin resistance protein/Dioxygenase superfamily.